MALRKIFLVHAKKPVGYDEFSGFVIIEKDEEAVRKGLDKWLSGRAADHQTVDDFEFKAVGTASKDAPTGIILKSFQAG
ncbi:hypothetical protein [Nocardia phage P3.1]|nr:hypothetical protein [Nocardia phage P3.1]